MTNNTIHIIGNGAIGSLCAALGTKNGLLVQQVTRTHCDKTQVHISNETIDLKPTLKLTDIESITTLVIPVKAYDVEAVLHAIKPKLTENATVILSHNGIGNPQLATQILGKSINLYFCTTSSGAFKKGNQVHLTGIGKANWGPINDNAKQQSSIFSATKVIEQLFFNATYTDGLQEILWRKLAVNAAINPLTAIANVNNGELLNTVFQDTIDMVLEELIAVAKALKIELEFKDLKDLVNSVIQDTAANSSSMRQDILARRQTEIDFINGYLSKTAASLNIPTPVNDSLTQQVKELVLL